MFVAILICFIYFTTTTKNSFRKKLKLDILSLSRIVCIIFLRHKGIDGTANKILLFEFEYIFFPVELLVVICVLYPAC